MKKVKRIYKYPTGAIVPNDAVYLNTIVQENTYNTEG